MEKVLNYELASVYEVDYARTTFRILPLNAIRNKNVLYYDRGNGMEYPPWDSYFKSKYTKNYYDL